MAQIDNGIEKERAFELPAGIWADGRYIGSPNGFGKMAILLA